MVYCTSCPLKWRSSALLDRPLRGLEEGVLHRLHLRPTLTPCRIRSTYPRHVIVIVLVVICDREDGICCRVKNMTLTTDAVMGMVGTVV